MMMKMMMMGCWVMGIGKCGHMMMMGCWVMEIGKWGFLFNDEDGDDDDGYVI